MPRLEITFYSDNIELENGLSFMPRKFNVIKPKDYNDLQIENTDINIWITSEASLDDMAKELQKDLEDFLERKQKIDKQFEVLGKFEVIQQSQ